MLVADTRSWLLESTRAAVLIIVAEEIISPQWLYGASIQYLVLQHVLPKENLNLKCQEDILGLRQSESFIKNYEIYK